MKAIAVVPGKPGSLHKAAIPEPRLHEVSDGQGVLVRTLEVGLDGTDREIASGKYGAAPSGADFLVLGHENLGVVEEVGPAVTGFAPGDYVVCMVRRHGQASRPPPHHGDDHAQPGDPRAARVRAVGPRVGGLHAQRLRPCPARRAT